MVEDLNLKTMDYAGTPDAMQEIARLEEHLAEIDPKTEKPDDLGASGS